MGFFPAVAGRAYARKLEAKVEAASPRPPSWAIRHTELSAGVLGETAPALAGRRRALGFELQTSNVSIGPDRFGAGRGMVGLGRGGIKEGPAG